MDQMSEPLIIRGEAVALPSTDGKKNELVGGHAHPAGDRDNDL